MTALAADMCRVFFTYFAPFTRPETTVGHVQERTHSLIAGCWWLKQQILSRLLALNFKCASLLNAL